MSMQRMIYWESDCGHKGSISTRAEALAPLVREARKDHDRRFPKCDMVDIERVETAAEREVRLRYRPPSRSYSAELCKGRGMANREWTQGELRRKLLAEGWTTDEIGDGPIPQYVRLGSGPITAEDRRWALGAIARLPKGE